MTENHAIRILELLSDFYAKLARGGPAAPHHVKHVPTKQWSLAARKALDGDPDLKPKDHLRVEHGTPRRGFARMVLELYDQDTLTEENMAALVNQYWKLAVITVDEDARLSRFARSKVYATPDERWAAAGISFSSADSEISN